MVGEPSRAAPEIDFALGGRDFRGDIGQRARDRRRALQRLRARDLGGPDQPQRHAPLARDRAALVDLPAVRARLGGRGDRLEPARGDRAVVRAGRARSSSSRTPRRRSPPTGSCSTTRPQAEAMGARARERVLDEHTYAHRARRVLDLLGLGAAVAREPRAASIAIVPALQRGGRDRRRRRRDPRLRPGVRRRRRSTTARRTRPRRSPRAHGAAVVTAPVQPRHRRRRADGLQVRARARLRAAPSGSTATASTTRPSSRSCSTPLRARRGGHRHGLALRRRRRRLPAAARAAASGSPGSRRLVSLLTRQRVTDTTSGFQALNRRGIALFAGDYPSDYPEVEATRPRLQAPAAARRGAGADARARARRSRRSRSSAPSTTCSR